MEFRAHCRSDCLYVVCVSTMMSDGSDLFVVHDSAVGTSRTSSSNGRGGGESIEIVIRQF